MLALGSGFIIDLRGYTVANNHVVANAEKATVVFQDNGRHPAKVVGRDRRLDLALLKIAAIASSRGRCPNSASPPYRQIRRRLAGARLYDQAKIGWEMSRWSISRAAMSS